MQWARKFVTALLVFLVTFLLLDRQLNKPVVVPTSLNSQMLALGPSTSFDDLAEVSCFLFDYRFSLLDSITCGIRQTDDVHHIFFPVIQ
jgi:hypothetical protein